jgi:NADH-quinone oxidoreductase subunit N
MQLLTFSVIVLAASSLGLPFLQFGGRQRGRLAAYVLITALVTALLAVGFNSISPQQDKLFTGLLTSDRLGGFFAIVTLTITLFVAIASVDYIQEKTNAPTYYSLLSFTALGMLLLCYSADLLMLFIAWELMSLPTYVLAGFEKKRAQSNEAAVKYAVIGALSSAILLYAISLAYGVAGTTQIAGVVQRMSAEAFNPVTSLAVILFIVGFGFKMSIVPFHMWIPDAYEGAPTTVSTLLAAATKKAGFIAAIRVLLAVATVYVVTQNPLFSTANVFAVLALVTMTLGNVALTQKSITRLLAYSSIAQAGYMLIGFVIFSYSQQTGTYTAEAALGLTGTIFHVLNHAVMTGAAFLAAGVVLLKLKRADLGIFNGLGKRMPLTAFSMTVALLGLAGVPPLSGFWSKLLLFTSVINGPFAWLAVAGILNSAFSLGYYAWIVKRVYIDEPDTSEKVQEPLSFVLVLAICVAIIVGFGLFPGPAISFAGQAASSVFPH